jgi:hypothetical protein
MAKLTSVSAFVNRDAVRSAFSSADHLCVEGLSGDCSLDVHVGADAAVSAVVFGRGRETEPFAILRVRGGERDAAQDLTVYLTADVLDQAVALRDALNRSIRFLRSKEARS